MTEGHTEKQLKSIVLKVTRPYRIIVMALIIFGACAVSYGFARIEDQQDAQNKTAAALRALSSTQSRENKEAVRTALILQANSDFTLCSALNKKLPKSLILNCEAIRVTTLARTGTER